MRDSSHRKAFTVALVLLAGTALPVRASQTWSGGVSATGVYSDKYVVEDGEDSDSSSLGLRGTLGVEVEQESSSTRLSASAGYINYRDEARPDRWTSELELRHRRMLTREFWIEFSAQAAANIATLEYRSADQVSGRFRVNYEPDDNNRFRAGFGYRRRAYDDPAGSVADVPFLGAEYRYRRDGRAFEVDVRQEWVNSDFNTYDYDQTTLSAFYSLPLSSKTSASLGATVRRTQYGSQPADPLTGDGHRRDWVVRPEISLTHDFDGPFDLTLDYRHSRRRSNDNAFDRNDDRVALTLAYKF